jgi:hypothetical protein
MIITGVKQFDSFGDGCCSLADRLVQKLNRMCCIAHHHACDAVSARASCPKYRGTFEGSKISERQDSQYPKNLSMIVMTMISKGETKLMIIVRPTHIIDWLGKALLHG